MFALRSSFVVGGAAAPGGGYSPSNRPLASGQSTVALDIGAGARGGNPQGTMVLPDSEGVVAFALQQAEAVRAQAAQQQGGTAEAVHWSFWAAWVVLGIGGGLAMHFYLAHKALAAVAT
jgi:hypothetical protein